MKISITTIPFHDDNIRLLKDYGLDVEVNPFKSKIQYEQLESFLKESDYVIAGTEKYDEALLKKLKKLKAISRVGVGTDNIDKKCADEINLKIFNTPDAPSSSVAEYCLSMTIFFLRDLFHSNARLNSGIWKRNIGLSLEDAKIFLWGGGRIASIFKDLLISCGAKNIFVYDVLDLKKSEQWGDNEVTIAKMEDICTADLISLHIPFLKSTKDVFNDKIINNLQNKPFLINTSRGQVVNDDHLLNGLNSGRLSAAALDVFDNEPYTGKLLENDYVFATPHIAANSRSARYNMERESCINILEYLNERK